MAKVRGAIVVDTEKCKGCGVCVVTCPTKVTGLAKEVNSKGQNYAYMANPESCVGCTSCGLVCPDSAITVYKAKAEAQQNELITLKHWCNGRIKVNEGE